MPTPLHATGDARISIRAKVNQESALVFRISHECLGIWKSIACKIADQMNPMSKTDVRPHRRVKMWDLGAQLREAGPMICRRPVDGFWTLRQIAMLELLHASGARGTREQAKASVEILLEALKILPVDVQAAALAGGVRCML